MIQVTVAWTSYPRWSAQKAELANGQRVATLVMWRLYVNVCLGKD